MNRAIRRVSIGCLMLVVILLVADNVIQVGQAQSLRDNPRNHRQTLARLSRDRGAILTGDQRLAVSVPVDDPYKYLRQYPDGSLYADVTGYFGLIGKSQVEASQDDVLSGSDSRLVLRQIADYFSGKQTQGGSVVLTIDPKLQQLARAQLGGRKGAVVAMNPKTGAILAVVTNPTYDPNPLASHDYSSALSAYSALVRDPNQPLLNRATANTYPPGSTFKLVTAAAALSSGQYTPDTVIPAPDSLRLPQSTVTLHNFGGESCSGAGSETLLQALTESCNTAFAQLGLSVGADALRAQARRFGFDSTFPNWPIDQAPSCWRQEIQNGAATCSDQQVDRPQTALSAIGQFRVAATPLQMLMVAAAIANGGKEMRPYLIKETRDPDGGVLASTNPRQLGQPVDGNVAAELTQMMVSVVQNGTGVNAQIPGVQVAGKTGTAQNAQGQPPHAWFVGFAPAQDPQIAVVAFVENSGGDFNGQGGKEAAPIAQVIMASALGAG